MNPLFGQNRASDGSSTHSDLTSGRLLADNTLWNLAGHLLPIVVALVAVPVLIRHLGVDRFGLLSLTWIVAGYFSLFDLGLGRALTKMVADQLGARQNESIPPLVWTTLLMMLFLGMLGGVIVGLLAPWLVHRALKVPDALQKEALFTFYLLALSIPIVVVTSGMRGTLEALQRFREANLIKIPASIFLFLGPLLVLPFSQNLVAIVGVVVLGRAAAGFVFLSACFHVLPAMRERITLDPMTVLPAVRMGMWMTVSNVIGPLMTYIDRFAVGALLPLDAVAYYTAPFDVVNRLLLIPGAVAGVLFPAFAVTRIRADNRSLLLLGRASKYIFLAMFPCVLVLSTLAPEILRVWIGPAFARYGSGVLRLLAAGVLVNSLAHLPFALIQGIGRADITAKLHLLELPFYLTLLWILTRRLGIEGTAFAWTARISLDAVLLCVFVWRLVPQSSWLLFRIGALAVGGVAVISLGTLFSVVVVKYIFLILVLTVFAWSTWLLALGPQEKNYFRRTGYVQPRGGLER